MRTNPRYAVKDLDAVRQLVRAHPFVTTVSDTSTGLVASHYPVLVDDEAPGLQLLGHVGRPDEHVHELGTREILLIVQGEHGYVSPGWYPDRASGAVPTWNFTVAHLSGVPQLLTAEENIAALGRMVAAFEDRLPRPRPMDGSPADAEYAARISTGTVGFRLPVSRFVAKRKLSQDKPAATVAAVIDAMAAPGPYQNEAVAEQMRAERDHSG